jgi:hypothetical protein
MSRWITFDKPGEQISRMGKEVEMKLYFSETLDVLETGDSQPLNSYKTWLDKPD